MTPEMTGRQENTNQKRRMELCLDLINDRVSLSDKERNQIREIIREQFSTAIEEEREACVAHADSVARTSALLPKDDPDRDGPKCARHIERLIRARSS